MNKDLYNRKVKLPDTLINHLGKSFEMVEADSNVEGYNRNKDLRNEPVLTYQQLKRIKNWFDSYNGNKEDAPFILNGGDRMSKWCNHVLDHWRKTLESGKQIKMDTGMENQFIKNHEKDGLPQTPGQKHEKGLNKYDVAVTENIKLINKLIKDIL